MENILPYLPHLEYDGTCCRWSSEAEQILKAIEHGRIQSGSGFVRAICDLRHNLSPSARRRPFSNAAITGIHFFFNEHMSPEESVKWYDEVFPKLATLLLKFPSLLEQHYRDNAKMDINGDGNTVDTCLRILDTNQTGLVFLSQELIAALLASSFFCLFPDENRSAKRLTFINFDRLFKLLIDRFFVPQQMKIWCILIYFQRICCKVPIGFVSFQRRVLRNNADFWANSATPLCEFEVCTSNIDNQSREAVLVYPQGKRFGGDVLGWGFGKAELPFLFSPELLVGRLFLPTLGHTEAIEIVGAERFITRQGFRCRFQCGDVYEDATDVDTLGRRKTRIVAIDQTFTPSKGESPAKFYLRDINKAFCAFLHQSKYESDNIGISSGDRINFVEKDRELKAIIKWLAASQAQRPFIAYTTYIPQPSLDKVIDWISSQRWTVGDVWKKIIDYSESGGSIGFLEWLQREYTENNNKRQKRN